MTGGAGFIGSVLVWELNRRGCTDIVIADFPALGEKQKNLAGLRYSEYLEPHELLARLYGGLAGKIRLCFPPGRVLFHDGNQREISARK